MNNQDKNKPPEPGRNNKKIQYIAYGTAILTFIIAYSIGWKIGAAYTVLWLIGGLIITYFYTKSEVQL